MSIVERRNEGGGEAWVVFFYKRGAQRPLHHFSSFPTTHRRISRVMDGSFSGPNSEAISLVSRLIARSSGAMDRVSNDPPDAQDQAPAAAPHALEVNNLPGF